MSLAGYLYATWFKIKDRVGCDEKQLQKLNVCECGIVSGTYKLIFPIYTLANNIEYLIKIAEATIIIIQNIIIIPVSAYTS